MVVPHPDVHQYKSRELPRVPPLIQNEENTSSAAGLSNMEAELRLPFQYIVREHAKSVVAIKELQNEVSSLLVLKDALLETFPHLHQRITGIPQDGRRLQMPKTGETDISDDIPSSWNTGSMPRIRKIRKSPEGSSTGSTVADSGFSTEKEKDSVVTSSTTGGKYSPPEVRWDTWTMSRGAPPPSPTPSGGEDELMSLLDVIHRKVVKLRNQDSEERRSLAREDSRKLPDKARGGGVASNLGAISESNEGRNLGAISESSELTDPRLKRSTEQLDRADRDILVDRISELENETIRSRSKVVRLENEIARVSKQKELLEDQLRSTVILKDKDGQAVRAMSEGPGGIIHSVQILTGDSRRDGSPDTSRILSQSESNLRLGGAGTDGSVNIEIRQDGLAKNLGVSRSSDVLNRLVHQRTGRLGLHPSVSVVNLRNVDHPPAVGGRLLPGGSVDELNRYGGGGGQRNYFPSEHARYFQNKITGPPMGLGKTTPQLRRVLSNEKLAPKSRSVENLYEARIRSSNSEISLQPRPVYSDHHGGSVSRIKGTKSEQVLTKIGKMEKVKLSESVVSMPAELARQHRGLVVKPNRERIRQILSTSSVLELQRQLLTTVMENEVYKSQLNKITETWDGKIHDFEKVNNSLQANLEKLKSENQQLKLQMEEKSIELEGTRARLRQLEKTSDPGKSLPEKSAETKAEFFKLDAKSELPPTRPEKYDLLRSTTTSDSKSEFNPRRLSQSTSRTDLDLAGRVTNENYVKYPMSELRSPTEPRVTFDLGPKKARITEVPSVKRAVTIERPASQLPSDARQRLQELAGQDIKRNYRKSGDPIRPSKLNINNGGKYIVSPPATPTRTQSPGTTATAENMVQKRTSLTRKDSRSSSTLNSAKNSLIMNFQNNNVKKASSPITRGSAGMRTRTPSVERSFTSKDDKDSSKDPSHHPPAAAAPYPPPPVPYPPSSAPYPPPLAPYPPPQGRPAAPRLLPAPPFLEGKGLPPNFTSIDIKRLEHDTIAELIAGILQKCSKKEEMPRSSPRQQTTADDTESEGSRPQTALRVTQPRRQPTPPTQPTQQQQRGTPTKQQQRGTPTQQQRSWETFNQTEEEIHGSHTAQSRGVLHSSSSPSTCTQYREVVVAAPASCQDSLALPDSLNDFEGEEFQSPNIYPDSLRSKRSKLLDLGVPEDLDSLQLLEELEKTSSHSPDSLNPKVAVSPNEFFDSITLEDKKPLMPVPAKRRIVPFCENSLSSGNSVFTSQDASFESKESSPTLNKIKQNPSSDLLYPDVTLSIRPLSECPVELSRQNRYSSNSDLRYKDDPSILANAVNEEQTKEMRTPQHLVAAVPHQNSNLKNGISYAKQATEKLKWKFLGW